jgi:hypothetical protein
MKRPITLIITLCATFNIWAQSISPQRNVLFMLGENEEIYYSEYFFSQHLNQNRFACVIKNILNNTYTFVFNGNRIVNSAYLLHVNYLNVNENNGYIISYWDGNEQYINNRGNVYEYLQECKFDGNNNEKFWYSTVDGNQLNYYVHSKESKAGPFEDVIFDENYDYLYKSGGTWYGHKDGIDTQLAQEEDVEEKIYIFKNNGKLYVSVYGRVSQGYDDVNDLHVTKSGKYTYKYAINGKYYVNINGKQSQASDDRIYNIQLTENGKYIYCYKSNGKYHVDVNGNLSEGYDYVKDLRIIPSGKYAYSYGKNDKEYVNINGKVSSGYDKIGSHWDYYYYGGAHITDNDKYAYSYKNNDKWYVNINGNINGGYDRIYGLKMDDKGNYTYIYDTDEGKLYRHNNGQDSKTDLLISNMSSVSDYHGINLLRTNNSNIVLYSTDKKHSFYSTYRNEYVIIDGKRTSKSPALHAWYDKDKNSFIWNSIEGKALVVYEHKL